MSRRTLACRLRRRRMKSFFIIFVGAVVTSLLTQSCSGEKVVCRNDSCYDRQISSVNPYKKGDIATWGTEKTVAAQEEEKDTKPKQVIHGKEEKF